ncbi:MAG: PEP-CTERM sorting domain-containing protein [Rubripirellula sp.]
MKCYATLLLSISLATIFSVGNEAAAGVIAGYSPDLSAAPGVTAGPIDDTGSEAVIAPYTHDSANSSFTENYETIGIRVPASGAATSGPSAVTANSYFQFHIAADAGLMLDLTSLTFNAYKGGFSGPRGWVLRTSVDNYAADVASEVVTANPFGGGDVVPDAFSVDLTAGQYQGLAEINFRLYAYAPTANFILNFTGLELNGNVVPEPSTAIAMGLLGVVGFAGNRRRRRQS